MSLLCAVDFSPPSALALAYAGRVAARFAQPLTILTVADPLLAAAEQMQTGDAALGLLAQALAEFVDETLGPGTSTRHRLLVPIGEPAVEILRLADTSHAQLILLSTHGASGVKKFMFGSVAERVLRTSERPVLVVPPATGAGPLRAIGDLQEVLVPIDFHDHAFDDARVASRVARASGATLRLLHVVPGDEAGRWSVLRPLAAPALDEQLSGARMSQAEKAREALQRLSDALGSTPPPSVEVVQGPPAEQIAQVAERDEVDLVVTGLRGAPGMFSARVGAVAYRVLCASPVPVLGLPHEVRGQHPLGFLG